MFDQVGEGVRMAYLGGSSHKLMFFIGRGNWWMECMVGLSMWRGTDLPPAPEESSQPDSRSQEEPLSPEPCFLESHALWGPELPQTDWQAAPDGSATWFDIKAHFIQNIHFQLIGVISSKDTNDKHTAAYHFINVHTLGVNIMQKKAELGTFSPGKLSWRTRGNVLIKLRGPFRSYRGLFC